MANKEEKIVTAMTIGGLVILTLGICHLVNYLFARAAVYIAYQLFNLDWYGKFWIVYLFVLTVSGFLSLAIGRSKK